jgi:hypothetical protein
MGMKAWGVVAAFLSVAGFISGAALANGLNQQEHKLMIHRIESLERQAISDRKVNSERNEKLMDKLNLIHAIQSQSEKYEDE